MDSLTKSNSNFQATLMDDVDADVSIIKIVILAVLGVASAFIFGYFIKLLLANVQAVSLLPAFLAGTVFLAIFLLNVFFIKAFWRSNLIILLESLAIPTAFYDKIPYTRDELMLIGTAILVSFLTLLWANYSGRRAMDDLLKIKFWHISRVVIPKAILAIALLSSVLYYNISYAGGINQSEEFPVSFSSFEKFLEPTAKIIQRFVPEFNPSLSVGELIKGIAQRKVKETPLFLSFPETQQKQLLAVAVNEINKNIAEFLGGVTLNQKDSVGQALYNIVVKRFAELPANIKTTVPIGISVVVFLIIVGLTLPIRWLVTIFAYVIYQVLLAVGFASVVLEGRSREIIILR